MPLAVRYIWIEIVQPYLTNFTWSSKKVAIRYFEQLVRQNLPFQ